jgi:hypothetical protein
MRNRSLKTVAFAITLLASSFTALFAADIKVAKEEAKQIAKEAYIYGYPRVMNCKTVYDYVVNVNSPDYKGPFNQVSCEARVK